MKKRIKPYFRSHDWFQVEKLKFVRILVMVIISFAFLEYSNSSDESEPTIRELMSAKRSQSNRTEIKKKMTEVLKPESPLKRAVMPTDVYSPLKDSAKRRKQVSPPFSIKKESQP